MANEAKHLVQLDIQCLMVQFHTPTAHSKMHLNLPTSLALEIKEVTYPDDINVDSVISPEYVLVMGME